MKTNFILSFILIILFSSCGSSFDKDLVALKASPLIEGQSVENYFNEIAGIGGKVTWEELNPTEKNVKKYKVKVVRSKSKHPTDVEVTFIYDNQTKNYAVEESLFQGQPQTITPLDSYFQGLRIVMSIGYKLNE